MNDVMVLPLPPTLPKLPPLGAIAAKIYDAAATTVQNWIDRHEAALSQALDSLASIISVTTYIGWVQPKCPWTVAAGIALMAEYARLQLRARRPA